MKVLKNNTTFLIDDDNSCPNKSWWETNYPSWENFTFDILDKFSNIDGVLIDVGTYSGHISLYAAQKYKKIYGFECDPIAYDCLQKNISINNYNNIESHYNAVYKELTKIYVGGGIFRSEPAPFGSSGIAIEGKEKETSNAILCDTVVLSEFLEKNNIQNISLIKMDIEGSERFLAEDIVKINKKYKCPLYLSLHPHLMSKNEMQYLIDVFTSEYQYIYAENFLLVDDIKNMGEYLFSNTKIDLK